MIQEDFNQTAIIHTEDGALILLTQTLFKVIKAGLRLLNFLVSTFRVRILFRLNGIQYGKGLRAIGVPYVNVSLGGRAVVGNRLTIRVGTGVTEVGMSGSRILVGPKGHLEIGSRVGISNVTLVCNNHVYIGDDVFIGGGVQIFDTNFHSTDATIRTSGHEIREEVRTAPIRIGARAFIGANAMIGKGVTIGDEAIVAAGSVVVSSIPPGAVWGGNPARKIR